MKKSTHCLQKQLSKERNHKDWLERNLKQSSQLKQSKKQIFKLQTAVAFSKQND
jgi:hypothetical protein